MQRDRRVALGLALFALLYMAGAWNLPRFALATGVVDAHVFPLTLGALLLVLSLVLYIQSGAGARSERPLLEDVNVPLLIRLMGATGLYALVLGRLGFVVATALFLLVSMALLGMRKWGRSAVISLGFSLGVYLIFAYVLRVPLARGILPF